MGWTALDQTFGIQLSITPIYNSHTYIHRGCVLDILFTENNGLDGIVHCDNCNSFAVLTGRIEKFKQVSQLDPTKPTLL